MQNLLHVRSFLVTRRTEQRPWKMHLQRAEKQRRGDIQSQILILFRFVILHGIQHQPRHLLPLARLPSFDASFAALTDVSVFRRRFWPAETGAAAK